MGQAIGHAQGSGKAVASDSQTVTLMDPLRVRVKGKEKAMDKLKRWCTECRSVDHDRRNCPTLIN
ncbi:protein FAR1-RELATED SEQUENCE 5-like [Prunus yedoensis var. nudiflora]|uniref:Protein FAR1-RELATED SEQUENCE 5-like n=1 Tax=Prunus yedoensis var. nudiflora TaxID=2094558 RepID=A0A314XIJ5_PRUYE|nr:protein FAR1-RELATED SEQUENCE 5-like [Prunus yedoensis var. nudiflora]